MYRCECCGHMSEGDGFIGDICTTCGWEEGGRGHCMERDDYYDALLCLCCIIGLWIMMGAT